jgi:hypothetical protein
MLDKPNITDLVTYKGKRYRVAYYKKRVEDNFPHEPTELDELIREIVEEELLKEKQQRAEKGLPHTRRFRWQNCTKDEATHVSLYGLTYPIAPIEEVIYEGSISWSQELIAEVQAEAVSDFRLKNYPFSEWQWE